MTYLTESHMTSSSTYDRPPNIVEDTIVYVLKTFLVPLVSDAAVISIVT